MAATEPIGVVLAGGASRRMGRDKATLVVAGETLAVRALRRLAGAVTTVVLADRGRCRMPGVRSVTDAEAEGPAGGLLGAAAMFPGRALLVLACDLPAVPVALLEHLADVDPTADGVMPCHGVDGRLEPLCARWGPAALGCLQAEAASGNPALFRIATRPGIWIRRLGEQELAAFGDPADMFRNLNTPADLRARVPPG